MTQRTPLAVRWHSLSCAILAFFFFACSSSGDEEQSASSSSELSSSNETEPSSSSSIVEQSSSSSDGTETDNNNSLLINFTSDYVTGVLRWMSAEATALSADMLDFGQDSKVASGGGKVFVLGSYPGTLSCISPETIGNPSAVKQSNLGDAQNPYDATVIGGNGYITMGDVDYLQVFNVSTCTLGDKINLPVSNASAAAISASGDTLLVILQRLDNYVATKPGLLVRINATSKTVIDTIQLKFYNPNSGVLNNGKLYISSQRYGDDFSIDLEKSGVEVVDLAAGTTEVIATGTELGGGAYGIALNKASQTLYVVVYEYWGSLPVRQLDLATKAMGTALPGIEDASGGLVFDETAGKLFVGDADGLKIYTPATGLTEPVNEGINALPPYSLAIVRW